MFRKPFADFFSSDTGMNYETELLIDAQSFFQYPKKTDRDMLTKNSPINENDVILV